MLARAAECPVPITDQPFASLLEEARGLAPRYRQQIEQTAGTIDTRNLAALLREV